MSADGKELTEEELKAVAANTVITVKVEPEGYTATYSMGETKDATIPAEGITVTDNVTIKVTASTFSLKLDKAYEGLTITYGTDKRALSTEAITGLEAAPTEADITVTLAETSTEKALIGKTVTLAADTTDANLYIATVTAVYANLTATPAGEADTSTATLALSEDGKTVTVTTTPATGYGVKEVSENLTAATAGKTYTYTVTGSETADVALTVTFEKTTFTVTITPDESLTKINARTNYDVTEYAGASGTAKDEGQTAEKSYEVSKGNDGKGTDMKLSTNFTTGYTVIFEVTTSKGTTTVNAVDAAAGIKIAEDGVKIVIKAEEQATVTLTLSNFGTPVVKRVTKAGEETLTATTGTTYAVNTGDVLNITDTNAALVNDTKFIQDGDVIATIGEKVAVTLQITIPDNKDTYAIDKNNIYAVYGVKVSDGVTLAGVSDGTASATTTKAVAEEDGYQLFKVSDGTNVFAKVTEGTYFALNDDSQNNGKLATVYAAASTAAKTANGYAAAASGERYTLVPVVKAELGTTVKGTIGDDEINGTKYVKVGETVNLSAADGFGTVVVKLDGEKLIYTESAVVTSETATDDLTATTLAPAVQINFTAADMKVYVAASSTVGTDTEVTAGNYVVTKDADNANVYVKAVPAKANGVDVCTAVINAGSDSAQYAENTWTDPTILMKGADDAAVNLVKAVAVATDKGGTASTHPIIKVGSSTITASDAAKTVYVTVGAELTITAKTDGNYLTITNSDDEELAFTKTTQNATADQPQISTYTTETYSVKITETDEAPAVVKSAIVTVKNITGGTMENVDIKDTSKLPASPATLDAFLTALKGSDVSGATNTGTGLVYTIGGDTEYKAVTGGLADVITAIKAADDGAEITIEGGYVAVTSTDGSTDATYVKAAGGTVAVKASGGHYKIAETATKFDTASTTTLTVPAVTANVTITRVYSVAVDTAVYYREAGDALSAAVLSTDGTTALSTKTSELGLDSTAIKMTIDGEDSFITDLTDTSQADVILTGGYYAITLASFAANQSSTITALAADGAAIALATSATDDTEPAAAYANSTGTVYVKLTLKADSAAVTADKVGYGVTSNPNATVVAPLAAAKTAVGADSKQFTSSGNDSVIIPVTITTIAADTEITIALIDLDE